MTVSNFITNDPGQQTKLLGFEPILIKRIVLLSWPVVLGMMTQSAINTIDVLMIGQLDEQYAIPGTAAVMATLILLWGFGGALTAISAGNQAMCARKYSTGDYAGTGQVLYNSIILAIVSSVIMTFIAYSSAEYLLKILTPSPSVQAFALPFCRIRLIALLSMVCMAAYKSFYDGVGRVKVHMTIAVIMNVLNIIFNYIFIFGIDILGFRIPAYYVNGAAIGSVLASYAGLIIMIVWSLKPDDRHKFKVYVAKNFDIKILKRVFSLSAWAGLATVILMLGVGLFNYIVGLIDVQNKLPDINSSASSIIIHIVLMVFMFCLAVGIATATLVSQSIGAKKFDLAERYCWQSVKVTSLLVFAFGLYGLLRPESILRLFLPNNLNEVNSLKDLVVQAAIPSFQLSSIIIAPLSAAGLIITQSLYGAGENRFVMIAEFILHFCIFVPLSWFFAIYLDFGLVGCWYSACVYASLLLAATSYRFQSGIWKHSEL